MSFPSISVVPIANLCIVCRYLLTFVVCYVFLRCKREIFVIVPFGLAVVTKLAVSRLYSISLSSRNRVSSFKRILITRERTAAPSCCP